MDYVEGALYLAVPVFLSESDPNRVLLTREVILKRAYTHAGQGTFFDWDETCDGPALTSEELELVSDEDRTHLWHLGEAHAEMQSDWELTLVESGVD